MQAADEYYTTAGHNGKDMWADFSWNSVYMGAAAVMWQETGENKCASLLQLETIFPCVLFFSLPHESSLVRENEWPLTSFVRELRSVYIHGS